MTAPSSQSVASVSRPGANGDRLLGNLARLGMIGATSDGGVTRQAFSHEDVKGRALVLDFMAAAGLETRIDPAGNLVGLLPAAKGDRPALLLGSHVDSVPNGGTLDGAYGVLAAIEVAHTITERGIKLDRPLAVLAFTNEEGTPEVPAFFGSQALAGVTDPLDGLPCRSIEESLAKVGGDLYRLAEAAWPAGSIAAYLELHIEQGPILDAENIPIGVVEAITGRTTVDITIVGATNHSGTTPMSYRTDALVAGASMILAVQALAEKKNIIRVATVGRCLVEPNAWNVVPGKVQLTVDLRDISTVAMREAVRSLRHTATEISTASGAEITLDIGQVIEPAVCDLRLRDLIVAICDRQRLEYITMPSGAGHDAQVIEQVAPIGMIFVPSIGGISHTPAESTAPSNLVLGADLLLQIVLGYDRLDY